jgi:hypothetical protein
MLHLDWKSFFAAARADNDLGNKNTSVYTKAWSPDKDDNMRFQTLVVDTDNVFLAMVTNNKIHALHNFKVAGGTLLRQTTKLMCLLGTGAHATALLVNKQSLLNSCNLVTPTIDELQACSNEDEVNKIAEPDKTRAVTYPGSASFFAAPWLVETIMSAGTSQSSKLIPAANAAAIEFDAEHKHNEDYATTATDHAGDFILWAWGVKAGQVSTTRLTMDPYDANLECFRHKHHQSCITQALWNNIPRGLPPPPAVDQVRILGLLNATIACQVGKQEAKNNILTKQLDHMIEKDGSSKNRVENLHKSTIKMLLIASAMNNKMVPTDLTESCKHFINSKMTALAEQELNLQFKNRGMPEVAFSSAYTLNMYHRIFLWSSADTPSNHSPFSLSKAEPI